MKTTTVEIKVSKMVNGTWSGHAHVNGVRTAAVRNQCSEGVAIRKLADRAGIIWIGNEAVMDDRARTPVHVWHAIV